MEKYKGTIVVLSILFLLTLAVAILIYILGLEKTTYLYADFVPPPFDKYAAVGVPDISNTTGYVRLNDERMAYSVCLLRDIELSDKKEADILFTNEARNTAWLKLRILDNHEKVIAETGLIKPGEYIQAIHFEDVPEMNSIVTLKVMGYEPYTYHSVGSLSIETKIGG